MGQKPAGLLRPRHRDSQYPHREHREPDAVYVQAQPDGAVVAAVASGVGEWNHDNVVVSYDQTGALAVDAPGTPLSRIALRWNDGIPERSRVLGDAWERSYGDLMWMGVVPHRILPWYWLAHDEATGVVRGPGVRVGPAAWCSWTVDVDGVTLWMDVRADQFPVEIGTRRLEVAQVVRIDSSERPFAAQTELT